MTNRCDFIRQSFATLAGRFLSGSMIFVTCFLLFSGTAVLAQEERVAQPVQTEKWVGSNYTPAYACNQVHFWHDFRADVVEKELAAAEKYFALNTLRVYLHPINFEQDKVNLFKNLETFICICAAHGIKPGFTFFDDCHRHEGIYLDKPTEPIKGYHNGRWAASPQDRDRDINNLERYKPYIQEIITKYANDNRILWWETFNEPNKSAWTVAMRKAAYKFAKEVKPKQPVICCWDDSPETDIVNAHNYQNHIYASNGNWDYGNAGFADWDKQADLNPSKGCVFTEAGARWFAPRQSSGEPVDVIRWLESRKRNGKYVPGVYLCWELMAGNSNCRWYWGTKEGSPEPTIPWCGLLWSDGTPVSLAEAEAVRHYVTGESRALFFDNFQPNSFQRFLSSYEYRTLEDYPANVNPAKWTFYRQPTTTGIAQVCKLPSNSKIIAGETTWNDYILESVVMLDNDQSEGNAGLIFRVNNPKGGVDDFTGYYAGFDLNTLYLGKFVDGKWNQLATYPLQKLDCKVVPNVWNQIRVEMQGSQIKVWFNRMHESADKENGLRIVYTDDTPITAGAIGLRTFNRTATFDNVIALPTNKKQ